MDPPPLPTHVTTTTTTTTTAACAATNITTQFSYPDSADSSPRARHGDTLDDSLPLVPGAKLRLMCSYGGHIIPRPHDKSLCYVGGDTRMVVVDRNSCLSDLSNRLSRALLNGRQFTLKYQLPNEDLDSLISVSTNEDLENMIEEYDRFSPAFPSKSARLRLFLFLAKPETAASMGSLLDDAKSETWFVDALNGSGLLPRGLSDSAAIDCLLEIDHRVVQSESCPDLRAQNEFPGAVNKQVINKQHAQDVHPTMPDSPMVETSSSFGSSSSTQTMSNLPPLRVQVEDIGSGARFQDQMARLDENFSHMGTTGCPPPIPTVIVAAADSVVSASTAGGVLGEHGISRVMSDDERLSDLQGAPAGFRKPPLPLQPVQRKLIDGHNLPSPDSKLAGGFNLPSPDSVASDSSIGSAISLSKHTAYQEPTHVATSENITHVSPIDPTHMATGNISDPSSQVQMQQQLHDSAYAMAPQQIQQQQQHHFVHTSNHYIHHPASGQAPISPYYQMYAPPPQQHLHHQIDHQYPMYFLPITQNQVTQSYNLPMQSNIADATVVASSRPPIPQNSAVVAPSAVYKETNQPIYPTMSANPNLSNRAAATSTPPLVQVPSNQFQQQYMGVHYPSQSIAAASAAAANYGYEYSHPTNDQLYYAQHPAAPLPQYQTMTSATAVLLSQASAQLPADNTNQQIRTTQPL